MKTVYYSDDFIIFIVPGLIVKRSNSTNLFITGIETSLCARPPHATFPLPTPFVVMYNSIFVFILLHFAVSLLYAYLLLLFFF